MVSYIITLAILFFMGIFMIIYALYLTLNKSENRLRDTATSLQVALVPVWLGIISIFIFASSTIFDATSLTINNQLNPIRTLSITLAIGGSSLVFGSFFGILFGIPRSAQNTLKKNQHITDKLKEKNFEDDEKTIKNNSNLDRYKDNTNIEEISDWLTKIIVGIGLVQLRSVPSFFNKLTTTLDGILGEKNGIFGISIIILLSISGFFIGYLSSRLFLPGALNRSLLYRLEQKQSDIREDIADRERYDILFNKLLRLTSENNNELFQDIDFEIDDASKNKLLQISRAKQTNLSRNFRRHQDEHRQLRKLRSKNLIRPREGGSWQAGKHIEITPFGKIYTKHIEKTKIDPKKYN